MGIVQVKIKNEGPTGSSTAVSEGKKEHPFRIEWQYRKPCFTVMKTKVIFEVSLRKSPLPKNNTEDNVQCIPNFQTGVDHQFPNPKPIPPTSFNQPTIMKPGGKATSQLLSFVHYAQECLSSLDFNKLVFPGNFKSHSRKILTTYPLKVQCISYKNNC